MRQKYGTELLETNYPISFHRGPAGHMDGAILLAIKMVNEVTKPNGNRQ